MGGESDSEAFSLSSQRCKISVARCILIQRPAQSQISRLEYQRARCLPGSHPEAVCSIGMESLSFQMRNYMHSTRSYSRAPRAGWAAAGIAFSAGWLTKAPWPVATHSPQTRSCTKPNSNTPAPIFCVLRQLNCTLNWSQIDFFRAGDDGKRLLTFLIVPANFALTEPKPAFQCSNARVQSTDCCEIVCCRETMWWRTWTLTVLALVAHTSEYTFTNLYLLLSC